MTRADPQWEFLLRLAANSNQVIVRRWLVNSGFDESWVRRRVDSGRLVTVFPGIYRLEGARLGELGRCMAATLSCGDGAVLSGRSALSLHDLIPDRGDVDVVRTSGRQRSGVDRRTSSDGWSLRLRRASNLPRKDLVVVEGVRAVRTERAICEVASELSEQEIRTVLSRGQQQRSIDWKELEARVSPRPGKPATALIRSIVSEWTELDGLTRSQMEDRAFSVFKREGLPAPLVNHPIGRWIADFYWPEWNLVVEVDGFAYHSDPTAFRRDREKDRGLQLLGLKVARFTWVEVTRNGTAMTDEVRRLAGLS